MTHSSSLKALMSSDPSIRVIHSESSVPIARRGSRVIQAILIAVLVITLGTVVTAIIITIKNAETAKIEAQAATLKAQETRRINAQPIRSLEEGQMADSDTALEEDHAYFSLFTSPEGAEVYRDEHFIGVTPIEQLVVEKAFMPSRFHVVLDGYEIERLDLLVTENYSNTLALKTRVIETAPSVVAVAKDDKPGVIANQAVVISGNQNKNSGSKKNDKTKGASAKAPETSIALPD